MEALTPHVNDVLFGRGTAINAHPGNRQFRSLVDAHKEHFMKAQLNKDKDEKRAIATVIFNTIRSMQPPGRFLVEDRTSPNTSKCDASDASSSNSVHPVLEKKTWNCVGPEKALDKILKRLRERDNEDMTILPLNRIHLIERRMRGFSSMKLPNPQPGVKMNDLCHTDDNALHRWGGQADLTTTNNAMPVRSSVDALNVQSRMKHHPQRSYPNACPDNTSSAELLNYKSSSILDAASTDGSGIRQYLEGSGIDFNDDSLLQTTTTHVEQDVCQNLAEYTLRQWIVASNPGINMDATFSMQSSNEGATYMKSALLIALKLTECILEADKDEQNGYGNPIPLASIAVENVLVRARKRKDADGESNEEPETIEFVWVMSFIGDDPAIGTLMSRLFAVGAILCELFSGKEFRMDEDDIVPSQILSMESISFNNEAVNDNRNQKKMQWRSTQRDDEGMSASVARLESNGVPWSLCALVKNLLECRHGSFRKDDAYASFSDLRVDLQLMVNNPSCFLDNICIRDKPKVIIPDKLFGRDDEVAMLNELFKRHITGKKLTGALISGDAGVGKSKLAMCIQRLANQSNAYFVSAKFEQHQMTLKPLSTIANMFDLLCEMVFNDSSDSQLMKIDGELTSVVGSPTNLLGVVPNLRKLMPSCNGLETSSGNCVDSSVSTRYLLGELLRVISSHVKPITLFIDDVQFADHASLLLVGNMLFSAQGTPIFFTLCHRDDEASLSVSFKAWLTSITMFALEPIKLESITPLGVNNLVSEALHLSPRLTHPLSAVLHGKTRGNPLFLRQLLDSLTEQGYIYIDLEHHRWVWDLDKIIELEISESVIALLMHDIQRLSSELQFGLQVAACIGSCVTESMINYVSIDLGVDLNDTLRQAAQKGFMIDMAGSTMFRFAHDKIQEAVYEMMPEQQRRENHMRFGLALCTQTLNNAIDDEEMFFAAVNQINLGGPTAVHEKSQKSVFAQLNLKAGRRSIELSDYNTALPLFQHGISFLGDDDWALNYQLCLDLYDLAADAALTLNKPSMVTLFTDLVVRHARCLDDKLHCLCIAAKALGIANQLEASIEACLAILLHSGEDSPRSLGDKKLRNDIDQMKSRLQSLSDDICNMQERSDKKVATLLSLYSYMAHATHYRRPELGGSVSLRMVELEIKTGLSPMFPVSLAYFGGTLVSTGCITHGCRLGKLALKLVERRGSLQYKSKVIFFVYNTILWASEPFQMIVEAHLLGYKAGQLSGDVHYSACNEHVAVQASFVVGQSLDIVRENILDFILRLRLQGVKIFFNYPLLLLSQIMVLKEGLHMSNVAHVDNLPTEVETAADPAIAPSILPHCKMHRLTRALLFRKLDDVSLNIDVSGAVSDSYHQFNHLLFFGIFLEGLSSFLLARHSSNNFELGNSIESANMIDRGHSVLAKMKCWSEHSLWNWENKVLLLEAESLFTNGDFDRAGPLYESAIRSAREHKFIHEEAIASDLAGTFYYERGLREKSYSYLVHSVACYEKWGAHAVARRVKTDIRGYFGNDIDQLNTNADSSLEFLFASSQGSEKKRQQGSISRTHLYSATSSLACYP